MGLLQTLIGQAKNPRGFVGNVMIKIMNKAHSTMTTWAFSQMTIRKDAPVLDIGCGGGQTIHMLSRLKLPIDIYGVDYSQQAVETSILKNREAVDLGTVNISRGEVSSLPFPDQFFGTITAVQTHYFWPDLKNDVKEIFRVLKPGGTFIIVSEIYKINYHMQSYTQNEEMEQLFQKAGFQKIEIRENKKWRCYLGYK
ncbi:class I SAM-dependent methyltransferase [Paenibacillus wynnii]|uniref:SAM-dependent methlyltransferase n=1 Tax=Paenibacillus wynnii TaxID=268407 RepID=A0A098M2G8_9BACL|nr:class I SAM-dependent methyltransferase [Paenibacillus wynnii]KGE16500.1 SAM-dependent methlyltransferase [Paenibacillus wynnii]